MKSRPHEFLKVRIVLASFRLEEVIHVRLDDLKGLYIVYRDWSSQPCNV